MTDIVKVTEEEFDDEGNLTRRTTTEYGFEPPVKWKIPDTSTGIKAGDVWPYPNGIVMYPNDGTYLVNSNQYNHGSLHSHRVGGTDRDGSGRVVG